MKTYLQLMRLFAAEGTETGSDAAAEIADIMDNDAPTDKEETSQESKADASQEQKQPEKSDEQDDDELEIEGMEELEDGRIKYTVGNSVYFSKEGLKGNKAISDLLRQERTATEAKDKAYQEMKQKTSQQKAASAITLPKTFDDEEEKLPEIPKRQAIVNHVFQASQLDPKMANWTDEDWIKYEDENGLRAWQTAKLQSAVQKAIQETDNYESSYVRQYNNAVALRQSRDSVRDMVADIEGVNPDDFAKDFHEILKRGMKGEGLNEFKELNPAWVVKEFGKVIGKTLTTRQKSKLESDVQRKVLESQEQRRKARPATTTGAPFKKTEKPVLSLAQATKEIMAEIGAG